MKIALPSRDSIRAGMQDQPATPAGKTRKHVYVLPSGRKLSVVLDEEVQSAGAADLAGAVRA
jgi:hypothetical protein